MNRSSKIHPLKEEGLEPHAPQSPPPSARSPRLGPSSELNTNDNTGDSLIDSAGFDRVGDFAAGGDMFERMKKEKPRLVTGAR